MGTYDDHDASGEQEFAVRASDAGSEVRRADSPDMEDSFIQVDVRDVKHPHHPQTSFKATRPQFYDQLQAHKGLYNYLPATRLLEAAYDHWLLMEKETARRLAASVFSLSDGVQTRYVLSIDEPLAIT
jgi:hypothetical protein